MLYCTPCSARQGIRCHAHSNRHTLSLITAVMVIAKTPFQRWKRAPKTRGCWSDTKRVRTSKDRKAHVSLIIYIFHKLFNYVPSEIFANNQAFSKCRHKNRTKNSIRVYTRNVLTEAVARVSLTFRFPWEFIIIFLFIIVFTTKSTYDQAWSMTRNLNVFYIIITQIFITDRPLPRTAIPNWYKISLMSWYTINYFPSYHCSTIIIICSL